MQRYTVLAALIMSAMGVTAQAATINVNTFADENGDNSSACSLREALKAVELKTPYGGCTTGERYYTDTIQLQAGTYTLSHGALVVNGGAVIQGASAIDQYGLDAVTTRMPARLPVTTTIKAQAGQQIFDTSQSRSSLSLNSMILEGGTGENGGAIRAGGPVDLERVTIKNASAASYGGAVYLEGATATLVANDSDFSGNTAGLGGAVIGLSCLDQLLLTPHTVNISRSSLIGNGSDATPSIIDYCGSGALSLTAVTIAKNQTKMDNSSAVIRFNPQVPYLQINNLASVNLTSNTIVENTSPTAIAYGDNGTMRVYNSILAFNSNMDCTYTGSKTDVLGQGSIVTAQFNLLGGTSTAAGAQFLTSSCQFPKTSFSLSTSNGFPNTLIAEGRTLSNYLMPLGAYASFTQGYLPKNTGAAWSLVDVGGDVVDCGTLDQRSVDRNTRNRSKATDDTLASQAKCDIGALELGQITAINDPNSINQSYTNVINATVTTLTPAELAAQYSPADVAQINKDIAENTAYIANYKNDFTYRRVYSHILSNDLPLEVPDNNGNSQFIPVTDSNYTVTTKSLGTGVDLIGQNEPIVASSNTDVVQCGWVNSLNALAIWRTDGGTTPSGSFERCLYTLTYKTGQVSQGIMQATISNVPPVAVDDTYNLVYGQQTVNLDILANDNDDGDGPMGVKYEPAGRTAFYVDSTLPASQQVNIRIIKAPQLGTLKFERQGYCPDNTLTSQQVCYGGKAVYTSNNTFSPFSDSFTYQVLDSDRTASNTATVKIVNTATTTDSKYVGVSTTKGGGAFNLAALLGLAAAAWYRRKYA